MHGRFLGRVCGMRSRLLVALLVCGGATTAYSAEPIVYAVHPLVVVGEEPQAAAKLIKSLEAILKNAEVPTVDSRTVQAFLQKQPDGACSSTECLARLARACETSALRLTIAPRGQYQGKPHVIVSGKIVDPAGVELQSMVRHYERKQETPGLAEAALERFIRTDLALGNPDLSPLTPVVPPEPTIIRVETGPKRPAWLIPTAAGATALAVVGVGLGTWFQLGAASKWGEVNDAEGTTITSTRQAELVRLRDDARAQQGQAVGAFVVGGAAAAAAGILFVYAQSMPDAPPAPVLTGAAGPAGAFILLSGTLP